MLPADQFEGSGQNGHSSCVWDVQISNPGRLTQLRAETEPPLRAKDLCNQIGLVQWPRHATFAATDDGSFQIDMYLIMDLPAATTSKEHPWYKNYDLHVSGFEDFYTVRLV